jgi:hypothetical protein
MLTDHAFVLAGVWVGAKTPVMAAILAEHGVDPELHTLSIGLGPFCLTLLSKVHELGADMLVMGAFISAPVRELLFGGVTRYMLTHADIPLLMRHYNLVEPGVTRTLCCSPRPLAAEVGAKRRVRVDT